MPRQPKVYFNHQLRPKVRRRYKRRPVPRAPALTVEQILAWADLHHERTGKWPTALSGRIIGSLGEKWLNVNAALLRGGRGLSGGSSLALLLAHERGARNKASLPRLTVEHILAWADAFHERTGQWPRVASGRVPGSGGEDWRNLDAALKFGARGLPGGSSLARLLAKERGARNKAGLPRLRLRQVLAWADAHKARTGDWPTPSAGAIPEAPGETWSAVASALAAGMRGFRGGSSLAQVLAKYRGRRNNADLPDFSVPQILAWADEHHRRTGSWPKEESGPVGATGETWKAVEMALVKGRRGLPGGTSLARLLAEHRGVRSLGSLPPLTEADILSWADAHRARTGRWPDARSGPVAEAPGETWRGVQLALYRGGRGLPRRTTFARLLAEQRGCRSSSAPLTVEQILAWADAHHAATGRWPGQKSGPVAGADETWQGIHSALAAGSRGLPGGSSLARLLAEKRGKRHIGLLPRLSCQGILRWARLHRRRTGRWPSQHAGPVHDAPGEVWYNVDAALRQGLRGLPGGSSLAQLLARVKARRRG